MISEWSAYLNAADVYLDIFRDHPQEYNRLDLALPHLQIVLDWLSTRAERAAVDKLSELVIASAPYLRVRYLYPITLVYLPICIRSAKENPATLSKLLLLSFDAKFMSGQLQAAKTDVQAAIALGSACAPSDLAQAYAALGMLEINRGDFKPALDHFDQAKKIYRSLNDEDGWFAVLSEEAAYYVDKENYLKAYELYSQVEAHEVASQGIRSGHTLSMIGVVSRRLKNLSQASAYFNALAQRGLDNNSRIDLASAFHHQAWVLIDQKNLSEARIYAETARQLYVEIHDPRGVSDADEQLGEIAFLNGNYAASRYYLKQTLHVRRQLENKVGTASASRRLSKTYFKQKDPLRGFLMLVHSFFMYAHLDMLTRNRIKRWFFPKN